MLFLLIFYGIFVKKNFALKMKKDIFENLHKLLEKDDSYYFSRRFIHQKIRFLPEKSIAHIQESII